MALTNTRFVSNSRLQSAARNQPAMRKGEKGHAVRLVQQTLIDQGYPLPVTVKKFGSPDGIFGDETRRQIVEYQRSWTLGIDGVVGKDTLTTMDGTLPAVPPMLPALPARARYIVPGLKVTVAQPSGNSCWATAYTMMRSWKDQQSYEIGPLIDSLGGSFGTIFRNDSVLPYARTNEFLRRARLTAGPMECFPPSSWASMLRAHGLLFVGGLNRPGNGSGHVRILYGVGGDGEPRTTTMMVMDPDGGRMYQETFERWTATYEDAAGNTSQAQIGHF